MKIKELIEELQQYDGDKEIMVWDWLAGDHIDIDNVSLFSSDDLHSNENPLSISINNDDYVLASLYADKK